eukprot:5446453-Amphidinium_carterae.1
MFIIHQDCCDSSIDRIASPVHVFNHTKEWNRLHCPRLSGAPKNSMLSNRTHAQQIDHLNTYSSAHIGGLQRGAHNELSRHADNRAPMKCLY